MTTSNNLESVYPITAMSEGVVQAAERNSHEINVDRAPRVASTFDSPDPLKRQSESTSQFTVISINRLAKILT